MSAVTSVGPKKAGAPGRRTSLAAIDFVCKGTRRGTIIGAVDVFGRKIGMVQAGYFALGEGYLYSQMAIIEKVRVDLAADRKIGLPSYLPKAWLAERVSGRMGQDGDFSWMMLEGDGRVGIMRTRKFEPDAFYLAEGRDRIVSPAGFLDRERDALIKAGLINEKGALGQSFLDILDERGRRGRRESLPQAFSAALSGVPQPRRQALFELLRQARVDRETPFPIRWLDETAPDSSAPFCHAQEVGLIKMVNLGS
ncbi:MAG: hypothetical protein WC901_01520 [Candidatus Margulisiibacteriota bacterium]